MAQKLYTFTFTLEITDAAKLLAAGKAAAALQCCDSDGTIEDALSWLIDNRTSPPGTNIQDSIAEEETEG